jgi:hypothetical protein
MSVCLCVNQDGFCLFLVGERGEKGQKADDVADHDKDRDEMKGATGEKEITNVLKSREFRAKNSKSVTGNK